MRVRPSRLLLIFVLCWIATSLLLVLRLDDRIFFRHHGEKSFDHDDIVTETVVKEIQRQDHINDNQETTKPPNAQDNLAVDKAATEAIVKEVQRLDHIVGNHITRKPPIAQENLAVDKAATPPIFDKIKHVSEEDKDTHNDKQPLIKENVKIPKPEVHQIQDNATTAVKDKVRMRIEPTDEITLPEAVYDLQPPSAPGELGRGVNLNISALSAQERQKHDELMKRNYFDEYLSNMISVRRSLVDIRNPSCPRSYSKDLPATSVIICFHNEAWTVLLRTVHSVLDRSPEYLVKEIILIDDFSDMDHLREPLEYYMSKLGKVTILRTKQREGLIRARLLGVDNATAPVLTFLDSHVECFPGWLEPLLSRVQEDGRRIVTPIINMISSRSFSVGSGDSLAVGMFKLTDLTFNWMQLPDRDKVKRKSKADPFRTPVIAGGLFAINREYFIEMGKYDEGMEIWGFENVEISLRIWMCGGSLETHPCSHVAHVFRQYSPYKWGRPVHEILHKNSIRLAEVWLDDYKHFYYERLGYKLGDYGNVTDRIELRKKLKCHSFQWYIDNVFPDITIPPTGLFLGEVRQRESEVSDRLLCLDSMSHVANGNAVSMGRCHHLGGNQAWQYTDHSEFRINDGCLTYRERSKKVVFLHCQMNDYTTDYQKWTKREDRRIIHDKTSMCLQRQTDRTLTLASCGESVYQIWDFGTFLPLHKPT